eukprot:637523-Prorocentrum_minimum.AAC.1
MLHSSTWRTMRTHDAIAHPFYYLLAVARALRPCSFSFMGLALVPTTPRACTNNPPSYSLVHLLPTRTTRRTFIQLPPARQSSLRPPSFRTYETYKTRPVGPPPLLRYHLNNIQVLNASLLVVQERGGRYSPLPASAFLRLESPSRDMVRLTPRLCSDWKSRFGGGSSLKHTTIAVTLSAVFRRSASATCRHRRASQLLPKSFEKHFSQTADSVRVRTRSLRPTVALSNHPARQSAASPVLRGRAERESSQKGEGKGALARSRRSPAPAPGPSSARLLSQDRDENTRKPNTKRAARLRWTLSLLLWYSSVRFVLPSRRLPSQRRRDLGVALAPRTYARRVKRRATRGEDKGRGGGRPTSSCEQRAGSLCVRRLERASSMAFWLLKTSNSPSDPMSMNSSSVSSIRIVTSGSAADTRRTTASRLPPTSGRGRGRKRVWGEGRAG